MPLIISSDGADKHFDRNWLIYYRPAKAAKRLSEDVFINELFVLLLGSIW